MGKRGLALGDGPWGPGGLHVRQFTFTQREDGQLRECQVTNEDVMLQLTLCVGRLKLSDLLNAFFFCKFKKEAINSVYIPVYITNHITNEIHKV